METTFKPFEIKCLKNTAKTTSVLTEKKKKLEEKINSLQQELNEITDTIEQWEYPIKQRFGYYTSELVNKVITTTDKVDKNGKPIKNTSFVLKYPETILPPTTTDDIQDDCDIMTEEEMDLREEFEDYMAQQEVDEAKNPTTTNPIGE